MPGSVRVDGVTKDINDGWVNVGDAAKEIIAGWINVSGAAVLFYTFFEPSEQTYTAPGTYTLDMGGAPIFAYSARELVGLGEEGEVAEVGPTSGMVAAHLEETGVRAGLERTGPLA